MQATIFNMRLTYDNQAPNHIRLTKQIESYFKILFDYHIEDKYTFSSRSEVDHPQKPGQHFSKLVLRQMVSQNLLVYMDIFVKESL